ncbi:MAG TPA: hypothetical protein VI819_00380 [Patescibacteria group bacterium]|nr:hypothetical protein [Patescibacteria group bacterium]
MSPIRVEIEGDIRINNETLTPGESRVINLGGGEGVVVERVDEDNNELYSVFQTDPFDPDPTECLQKINIAEDQKSGHFYIGDTKVSAWYVKKTS